MRFLTMKAAELDDDAVAHFEELTAHLSTWLQPLLGPTLIRQGELLGISRDLLAHESEDDESLRFTRRRFTHAEIFIDTGCIYVTTIRTKSPSIHVTEDGTPERSKGNELRLYAISNALRPPNLDKVSQACSEIMSCQMDVDRYSSSDFERLKEEAVTAFGPMDTAEVEAARILTDKSIRELATRIKQSFGLLVSDLGKKQSSATAEDISKSRLALESAAIVSSEFMVTCTRNSVPTARAPSAEVITSLASAGVKCACGKPIDKERIDEALAITDLGASLLDKSRWLSLILRDELIRLGVPEESILIESTIGGDELDCIADINGEICLFELKDKEFSLREAYSFGAKINIVEPQHSIIVTSEYVGGDAREHFERWKKAGRGKYQRPGESAVRSVVYIEGIEQLRSGLEDLISSINHSDAANVLTEIASFGMVSSLSIMASIDSKLNMEKIDQSDPSLSTEDISAPVRNRRR